MNRLLLPLYLLTLVLICSCTPQSLHPFYTEKNKIAIPKNFLGEWDSKVIFKNKKDNEGFEQPNKKMIFEKDKVICIDPKGEKGKLNYQFFKVNNKMYCSFTAGGDEGSNPFLTLTLAPVYTCFKVNKVKNKLHFIPLSIEKINEFIQSKELKDYIPSKDMQTDRLLTASPEFWETIIKKYSDKGLFDSAMTIELR